jgi:hypothetical protein
VPRSPALPAGAAAALVTAGIFLGSRNLANFDAALVGYAIATIFMAFGVTYRTVAWSKSPAARRYLVGGWKALLSPGPAAGGVAAGTRTVVSTLFLQRFIAQRSRGRWLAHQGLFWGVVIATAITFPLTFGWIHFRAVPGTPSGYWVYVVGVRTAKLDALSLLGWMVFHGLDVAAVLVVGGCIYFLRKRWAERRTNRMNFGKDVVPLLTLLAISLTGLALTVSSALLSGLYYHPLAFAHMCTVVLTLVWVPFGKFFHTIQRPAMIGVHLHKQSGLSTKGVFQCRSCGMPLEGAGFVDDLQATMAELGLAYGGWIETCPRCKRLERGARYRTQVKAGF